MSSFLYVTDDENLKKINIDDLYENKQKRDLKQILIFNKILNRVQKRIELTARNKRNDKHIWFIVPEYIFGEPVYDKGDCIGYLVTKLEDNGFHVRYMHPNTLFVSWMHWVPSYVRNEIKKKTGNVVDQFGNLVKKGGNEEQEEDNVNSKLFNEKSGNGTLQKEQKQYTPIDQYKPSGNLVYKPEHFQKIEKKVTFS
jgi:hypothetical protein